MLAGLSMIHSRNPKQTTEEKDLKDIKFYHKRSVLKIETKEVVIKKKSLDF
jgi:hypothetical protein